MKYSIFDAMNFKQFAQKIVFSSLVVLPVLFLSGCSKKSALTESSSEVDVLIPNIGPVSTSNADSVSSDKVRLQVVRLYGIENLKEVSGQYAKFYYAPGVSGESIIGPAPQAQFYKTASSVYLPGNSISQQLASIYYHTQNLFQISELFGLKTLISQPFKIGVQTQIASNPVLSSDNAFYDSMTDSMIFVPYTLSNIPIAVNGGIIAHEFFHAIFSKIILASTEIDNIKSLVNISSFDRESHSAFKMTNPPKKDVTVDNDIKISDAESQDQTLTTDQAQLFNQTFIRGINEGLADFWAWVYTEDDDFIKWSLPSEKITRSLTIKENEMPDLLTKNRVLNEVNVAIENKDFTDPSKYMSQYIYQIGTPYAQFLKSLVQQSNLYRQESSSKSAKLVLAKMVIQFLKTEFRQEILNLQKTDTLKEFSLFNFMNNQAAELNLNEAQCENLKYYIHLEASQKKNAIRQFSCQKNEQGHYQVLVKKIDEVDINE